jgi:hypothetical protein
MSRPLNAVLLLILTAALAFAQQQPQAGDVVAVSADKADLLKALETIKKLEARVAQLEQELAGQQQQQQSRTGAAPDIDNAPESAPPPPPDGARRPVIEEEEPFDAAKVNAADEAEVEAVARAVAMLLPDNVKQLSGAGKAAPAVDSDAFFARSASTSGLMLAAPEVTVEAGGPKPKRRTDPKVPASMRNSMAGEVNVSVKTYVDANGEVIGTVAVRKGDPAADQIAVLTADAVTRWQFAPVRQNGKPVPSQTVIHFRFTK